MTYVPQYDGLRAFAVALVIGFHMPFFDSMPGGYIGVDVFFVLSGFLTCKLALAKAGHMTVLAFMKRRFFRLAPALYAMIVTMLLVTFLMGFNFVEGAIPAVFFLSNGWNLVGSEIHVFSHAWSLAIEMKFYLLIAIAVLLLGRHLGALRWLLAATFVVQTLLRFNLEMADWDPNYIYSRFWLHSTGLFLGAFLATFRFEHIKTSARIVPICLVVLSVLALTADKSQGQMFSAYMLLAEVMTAFLLVSLPRDAGLFGRILGHSVAQSVGRWSYGIYLWHIPVIFVVFAFWTGGLGICIALVATVVIAAVSHHLIERPFTKLGTPKTVGALSIAA